MFYREKVLGDDKAGTLTLTCDTSKPQSGTWTAPASDDYHFVMTKSDNDVYIVGSGYDQHPS
ncbi:hypothetical protein [Luteimicrobium subarcticum]|uniref:Uncharacterized protein n=1 Tax=Luteimicrobium subarcticum TaxID=620910 RepID=A0A2M8W1D4_9MICO|nr:hypothetical protein [Luteimicrobium subarcticum]PJI84741.1 hypothetical protein CLV34_3197 [Luteimicrobium subarcticum]